MVDRPKDRPGRRRAQQVRLAAGELGDLIIDRPTRRRAGVFRRALRREVSRLRDSRRLAGMALLIVVGGLFTAGLIARGEAAGADAHAYWAAVRIWLNGGDPYHPSGPFMPYVYSPWLLPAFAPWALLPWDVAWFAWRGATVLGLLWTADWAYRRRPLATVVVLVLLSFPLAANIDTGNITLLLALFVWAAQFTGPRLGGLLWALATSMKWVPALLLPVLAPRARLWGLIWLGLAAVLTIATLPATLVQLQVLFGFSRPVRLDYLVLLWAAVPWVWRHPQPLWWARPSSWPAMRDVARTRATGWRQRWATDPEETAIAVRRGVERRLRGLFGLGT